MQQEERFARLQFTSIPAATAAAPLGNDQYIAGIDHDDHL